MSGAGLFILPRMSLAHLHSGNPLLIPLPLYRYRDGIVAVDLLGAAVAHLDFFTWLADHPSTLGAICANFEIHPRPADVMMTLFTAMGLITQSGGVFHLTLRAREHLVATSPWNLAPYYVSMKDRPQTHDMLKVLRHREAGELGQLRRAGLGAGDGAGRASRRSSRRRWIAAVSLLEAGDGGQARPF